MRTNVVSVVTKVLYRLLETMAQQYPSEPHLQADGVLRIVDLLNVVDGFSI